MERITARKALTLNFFSSSDIERGLSQNPSLFFGSFDKDADIGNFGDTRLASIPGLGRWFATTVIKNHSQQAFDLEVDTGCNQVAKDTATNSVHSIDDYAIFCKDYNGVKPLIREWVKVLQNRVRFTLTTLV